MPPEMTIFRSILALMSELLLEGLLESMVPPVAKWSLDFGIILIDFSIDF